MDINKAIDDNLPSALSELDNEIEVMLDKIVEKVQLRSELDILAKIKGKFNPVIPSGLPGSIVLTPYIEDK